jgi:OmpA-OmpF porin, OOP family
MRRILSKMPAVKRVAPLLLVSAFLLPSPARAEIKAGSVELSPFAGYNFFQSRQNLENAPIYGGRLGYNFTEHFGVEATGEFIRSSVDDKSKAFTREGEFTSPIDDVNITMYHLDLIYHFMPEAKFNPFIAAGYGAVHYSEEINNKNMSGIDFGIGAKYWLADNVALRVDVRDNLLLDEQIHNIATTLGVVLRFGGKSNAVVAQVAQPVERDSDGDGVPDGRDRCPGTPGGTAVDQNGCPGDADRDGVADYLDKCSDTPQGVAVDKNGCPLDGDNDGVADYQDKCPGTAAGVVVEENGCPPPVKGVILPPEPKHTQEGVAASEPQVMVLAFEDVHFDFDQSTLKPEAKTILKRNILLLKENPNARIRIAGYTSAAGTEEHNQKLSERRAESVRRYLVDEGVIGADRLTMVGYGESNPAVYEQSPKDLNSPAAKANIRVLFEITVQ